MQDVVDTFVAAGLLHRYETIRLFDDADYRMISAGGRAKAAGVNFGEIVTNRTEDDSLLYFPQGNDQSLEIGLRRSHYVKRQSLRRLVSNAR